MNNMDDGNTIECIEKYETKDKKDKNKKIYDKVMKILGLSNEEINEKN